MGANDSPLPKSCNSSVDNVILLRLCTVREGLGLRRGLGIKNDLLSCV